MKKKFNITGVCHPDYHYLMDTREKLAKMTEMIESGEYSRLIAPVSMGKQQFYIFYKINLKAQTIMCV
jgi:hypothetical protein